MSTVNDLRTVKGKLVTINSSDSHKTVSLTDNAVINWDVSQGSNAIVMLNHNLATRMFAVPYNLVSGQTYTLTLIQDKVGGAGISFASGVNVYSSINMQPIYKTTITFVCASTLTGLILNSLTTSYQIDTNQQV